MSEDHSGARLSSSIWQLIETLKNDFDWFELWTCDGKIAIFVPWEQLLLCPDDNTLCGNETFSDWEPIEVLVSQLGHQSQQIASDIFTH